MKKIILKGKRLTLRPVKIADAEKFFKWLKDKEVIKYLTVQKVKNLKEEQSYIKKINKEKDRYFFSIVNENKLLIGNTNLKLSEKNKKISLGIIIGEKKEWDKGYGTETMRLLIDFVFKKLKYNRLELDVYKENKRAIKVYKRVGFKKEGIKREGVISPVTKKYADLIMMSILKSEYKK